MASDPTYDDFDDEGGSGIPAQLREPIKVVRRQIRWIVVTAILGLIATGVATHYFPESFEARATILLTEKSIPENYVPTTITANINEQFEAIRGVVFSRTSLAKIAEATGVYSADLEGASEITLASRLRSELIIETIAAKSRSKGAPHSVSFEIKMKGAEPQALADVVNMTVSELIDANYEYRGRQARITTQFMQREFDGADAALRSHQRDLAEFRALHRGGALPEEQDASLSRLARLEDQRRSSIMRVADLRARLERIETRPDGIGGSGTLEALRIRLQQQKAIYTDDHPTVRSLERQIAEAEGRTSGDGQSIRSAASDEHLDILRGIDVEQGRLAQIDNDVRELELRLATAPEIVEEYGSMVREEQILQENYVEFLRKLKSAQLALSLEDSQQGAQLTRVDAAIPPGAPIVPRWMVAAGGIVVSLGLGIFIGIARELLFPVIIDEQHLEDEISAPCLGSIPEIA